jgi:hypothetical protein
LLLSIPGGNSGLGYHWEARLLPEFHNTRMIHFSQLAPTLLPLTPLTCNIVE